MHYDDPQDVQLVLGQFGNGIAAGQHGRINNSDVAAPAPAGLYDDDDTLIAPRMTVARGMLRSEIST